jgi:hypothetical protein
LPMLRMPPEKEFYAFRRLADGATGKMQGRPSGRPD